MQPEYKCPLCGSAIGIDDVNVVKDNALCRSCGKTTAFSMINSSSQISLDVLNKPPRSVRIENDIKGGIKITYSRPHPILLLMIPLMTLVFSIIIWSIHGELFKGGHLNTENPIIFFVPVAILVNLIIFLGIVIFLLCGQWVITLQNGTGKVFVGLGSLGWTRHFTYNLDSMIALRVNQDIRINEKPQKGILIQTDEKRIFFGSTMKEDVKQFILAAITKEIKKV